MRREEIWRILLQNYTFDKYKRSEEDQIEDERVETSVVTMNIDFIMITENDIVK